MRERVAGIIGSGNIGAALIAHINEKMREKIGSIKIFDIETSKAENLANKYDFAENMDSAEAIIRESDIVVETACADAVPAILQEVILQKKDLMILSIGGLLGSENLIEKARSKGIKLLLPSGAVSGIDALKASGIAGIKSVSLTTRKSPRSIKGAPYLAEKGIDAEKIDKPTVIFEGSAAEAMKGFPKNINVSALLSIAGIGADRTGVKIIVSPEYTRNTHEIEIISHAGQIKTVTQNIPSPDNPKTSYLAVLSAISALEGYFDTVRIGT